MKYKDKDAFLRSLRAENKSLKKENEYLRHRLEQLGERSREKSKEQAVLLGVLATTHVSRAKTYFGYLLFRLRTNRWFRIFDKTSFAVRGLLLASKIWRIAMALFALIGIGAQVILVIGIFAVLLPAAAIFSVLMATIGFFSYRKWNSYFQKTVQGQKIYILFLPKKYKRGDFVFRMANAFSEGGIVFGVSRSVFNGGFFRLKKENERFYLIPFGYYFSLRKHIHAFGILNLIIIH